MRPRCREDQLKRSLAASAARAHDRIRRRLGVAVVAAMAVVALGATTSYAASPGAQTRGDAQAQFEAFFTGGMSIRLSNPEAQGVPGVPIEPPLDSARIYPLLDGVEYCQGGWHVVMLGIFDDPTLYAGGKQELRALLSAVTNEFILDGVPLEVKRTAIKRFQHPPPEFSEVPFIVFTDGAFLPPGSLTLGTHELRTLQTDPVFGDSELTVSFTVVTC